MQIDMNNERKKNIYKYENEKGDDLLKNAELCDNISKWSTNDKEVIYWKKQGLSIREKFYGKDSIELTDFYIEISKILLGGGEYKKSLHYCEKALLLKEKCNSSYADILDIYSVMITSYYLADEFDKGIVCGLTALNDVRMKQINSSESVIQIMKHLVFMYEEIGQNDEMKKWLQKGIEKAIEWYGENSVQSAEMYIEKARYTDDKVEKLKILKIAFETLLHQVGMYDYRTRKAYRCIWTCWEGATDKPIESALKWLKENLSEKDFSKVYDWVRSNMRK